MALLVGFKTSYCEPVPGLVLFCVLYSSEECGYIPPYPFGSCGSMIFALIVVALKFVCGSAPL